MKGGHLTAQEEAEFLRQTNQILESIKKNNPGVSAATGVAAPPSKTPVESKPLHLEDISQPMKTESSLVSPPPDDPKKLHPPSHGASSGPAISHASKLPSNESHLAKTPSEGWLPDPSSSSADDTKFGMVGQVVGQPMVGLEEGLAVPPSSDNPGHPHLFVNMPGVGYTSTGDPLVSC